MREIHNAIDAIYYKDRLARKSNLSDDEKILLKNAQEFLDGNIKRMKNRFGIPEDAPLDMTLETIRREHQKSIEISQRDIKESQRKIREIRRWIKEIEIESEKNKMEMNKKMWNHVEKRASEWKGKGLPNYIETNLMEPTENIELPACNIKCDRSPLKKRSRNKLLNMSTG